MFKITRKRKENCVNTIECGDTELGLLKATLEFVSEHAAFVGQGASSVLKEMVLELSSYYEPLDATDWVEFNAEDYLQI